MNSKFLPIGTVVLLKEAKKKLMITGFCVMAQETGNKMYDYSGCIYPEGYLSSDKNCLFDHSQIDKIFYLGFRNDEEVEFKNKLNEVYNQTINKQNESTQNQPKIDQVESIM